MPMFAAAHAASSRADGLSSLEPPRRSGQLSRVTGEVAESIAEIVLDEHGYNLFWQITTPGEPLRVSCRLPEATSDGSSFPIYCRAPAGWSIC
jgi:hypothetical protein